MSETRAGDDRLVVTLGFKDGDLIQEFGYDDDVDFELRGDLEEVTGSELLDEDDQEIVDGVLVWWRSEDGDLVDGLMDVLSCLDEGGAVWLLTPKAGRDGYVAPVEVQEAAPLAGLHVTTTEAASQDWAATRLVMKQSK